MEVAEKSLVWERQLYGDLAEGTSRDDIRPPCVSECCAVWTERATTRGEDG